MLGARRVTVRAAAPKMRTEHRANEKKRKEKKTSLGIGDAADVYARWWIDRW